MRAWKSKSERVLPLYSGIVPFLRCPGKFGRSDAAWARGGRAGRGSQEVAASPLFLLRFLWRSESGPGREVQLPSAGTGMGAVARGRAGRGSRAGDEGRGQAGRGAEPPRRRRTAAADPVPHQESPRPRLQGWPSPRLAPFLPDPGSHGPLSPSLDSAFSGPYTLNLPLHLGVGCIDIFFSPPGKGWHQ